MSETENIICLRGTKRPHPPHEGDDGDLAPPDPEPNKNSNGRGTKRFKPNVNHWVKVIDAFRTDKERMIVLEIKFKPVPPKHPDRDKELFRVMIPFKAVEKKVAHEVIREKLFSKTHIQPFFGNDKKYANDLIGSIQHFEDYERDTVENSQKTVLVFEKPSPFENNGTVYFACGDVWQISSPVKKMNDQELVQLPFVVEYTGEKLDFELDEKKTITTLVSLIKRYSEKQPEEENRGFFIAYMARSLECLLYLVLIKRYTIPVTYCSSGEEVGCGKTTACVLCQLMLTGQEVRCGEFSGSEVSKLVAAGNQVFCDELHLTRRDSVQSLVNIITGQFQGLKRMVGGGGGGQPRATVAFHCNKPPSDLKLRKEVLSRLIWVYAGEKPMLPFTGYQKMLVDARELYKYLPNLLNIGVECFFELVPDDKLADLMGGLGNSRNVAQQFWNLERFHVKLQELATKNDVDDLPGCLQRDVDRRPFRPLNSKTPEKPMEEIMSALDENLDDNECWFSSFHEVEGIKVLVSGLRKCPEWVQEWALKNLQSSTQNSKRFRFFEVKELQHQFIDRMKAKDAAAKAKNKTSKKGRRRRSSSSSESSDLQDFDSDDSEFGEEEFDIDEDINILKAVAQPGMTKELKNDRFWQRLEAEKIVQGHKWQTIRDRFYDGIIPNLHKFQGIPSQFLKDMQETTDLHIHTNVGGGDNYNEGGTGDGQDVSRDGDVYDLSGSRDGGAYDECGSRDGVDPDASNHGDDERSIVQQRVYTDERFDCNRIDSNIILNKEAPVEHLANKNSKTVPDIADELFQSDNSGNEISTDEPEQDTVIEEGQKRKEVEQEKKEAEQKKKEAEQERMEEEHKRMEAEKKRKEAHQKRIEEQQKGMEVKKKKMEEKQKRDECQKRIEKEQDVEQKKKVAEQKKIEEKKRCEKQQKEMEAEKKKMEEEQRRREDEEKRKKAEQKIIEEEQKRNEEEQKGMEAEKKRMEVEHRRDACQKQIEKEQERIEDGLQKRIEDDKENTNGSVKQNAAEENADILDPDLNSSCSGSPKEKEKKQCPDCSKSFPTARGLGAHKRWHKKNETARIMI